MLLVASGAGSTLATWRFDGSTWAQIPTAHAPSDRIGQQIAYDAARDRLLVYGGQLAADTWLFDGTDWQQATPASSPGAFTGHRLAYDAVRQECVLFHPAGQTWTWNGSTWTFRTTSGPSSRISYGMTWDPQRQRVVLTGGADPNRTSCRISATRGSRCR